MARDLARGADRSWVENLYRFALVPDAVFYLRVSPRQLVERTFRKNSELDFWESGMDIGLSRDRFDSFVRYQTLIQKQFTVMHERYGFQVVNANRTPAWSNRQLRAGIEQMLAVSTYEGRVPRAEHYRPLRRS
jgi:dTMP kinase